MDSNALEKETPVQTVTRIDSLSGSGILEDVRPSWHDLRGLTQDRFRLGALGTQRAGQSLVGMVVTGAMVVIVLIRCLTGIYGRRRAGLVEHGMAARSLILLAVAFNLLLALILLREIRRKKNPVI